MRIGCIIYVKKFFFLYDIYHIFAIIIKLTTMKKFYLFLIIGAMFFLGGNDLLAQFNGGDGTSGNPWQINTAANLNAIRTIYLTDYFIQTANIVNIALSYPNWDPIGDDADGSRFTGNYDGNGFTISGLTISRPTEGEVGLFGCLGLGTAANPAVIKKVELVSAVSVSGARGTGSLVGRVRGNIYTIIENCSASGGTVSGNGATGGLVGANNSAKETNGGTDNPTLSQSWANIDVTGVTGGNGDKIGGLVGCNQKGNTINCYALGSVTIPASGTFTRIGGLAGCTDLRGSITTSFSTGSVSVNGNSSATLVGGLVGHIGSGGNKGVVTNAFWNTTTSGQSTSAAGTGLTTAQMKVEANFTGFDFTYIWNIDESINSGYPFLLNTGVTTYNNWTGTTSTTWSTLTNWSAGRLPIYTDIAVIPSGLTTNYPIITSSEDFVATAKILDIPLGGSLTINALGKFEVIGDLRSETTSLIIKSDASGTGSLLHDAEGVNATVERYLTDNSWHGVTPSTTGVTVDDFHWSDVPESWLTYHTESTNGWTYMTDLTTELDVGQGYMVWLDLNAKTPATATMEGILRSSDLSQSLEYLDGDHGANFVGNPFASAIDVGDGTGWTFTNIQKTIYVWNPVGNYLTWVTAGGGSKPNGIVPVGQGFFVVATSGSPVLTIPVSARTHSTQAFYKENNASNGFDSYMTLRSSYAESYDEIWVSFGANGTTGFDNGWDASKMFGGEEAPQLFLVEGGKDLSIDHLFTLGESELLVNMSFIPGIAGQQTFTANLDNLPNTKVTLEDLKTSVLHELSSNSVYDFEAEIGDDPARFKLHFLYSPDGISESEINHNNDIQIYAHDSKIYIRSQGNALQKEGQVQIYDLLGRVVYEQKIGTDELVSIPVNTQQTCLIVKVRKGNAVKSTKIIF